MFGFMFLLISCFTSILANYPTVVTEHGTLRGTFYKTVTGREIFAFYGVPYAAPPVGQYRFEPPQPLKPWMGEWNASIQASDCLKYAYDFRVVGEEDCLYLNVYTPKLPTNKHDEKKLDVIAFIHGGGFSDGSGNSAFPDYLLMSDDVVFVTINYRLGALGFLSTGDEIVPGNNGLKDQNYALRWIRTNIDKFGGNPDSVTLAGISAGAASVHYHSLSPMSEGLFHRGIMQSGSALSPRTFRKYAPERSKRVGALLGCPTRSSVEMIECLKSRPAKQIGQVMAEFLAWYYNSYSPFGPIEETPGSNRFSTEHSLTSIRNGKIHPIPLLISTTKDEGLNGIGDACEDENIMADVNENWNRIAPHLMQYNQSASSRVVDELSNALREKYFGDRPITTRDCKTLVKIIGERLFIAYTEFAILEQASQNKSPLYYMKFNYRGKYSAGMPSIPKNPESWGVRHCDDTLYVVKKPDLNILETSEDAAVSNIMTSIWLSFARTGVPKVQNETINWQPVSKNAYVDGIHYLSLNSANDANIRHQKTDTSVFEFWNSYLHEFPPRNSIPNNNEL